MEKQEQHSRRNCLLLKGIPEDKNENNDELSITAINDHLETEIKDRYRHMFVPNRELKKEDSGFWSH